MDVPTTYPGGNQPWPEAPHFTAAEQAWREALENCIAERMHAADFDFGSLDCELGLSPRQLQRRVREHYGVLAIAAQDIFPCRMSGSFRAECRRIIFRSDRWDEKAFDVFLIMTIVLSVGMVLWESVPTISPETRSALYVAEWVITILFTLEYLLRLYVAESPARYSRSFFGIVDLLAILPSYIDLLIPGAHYLMLLRVLRVLRIFRVLKLAKYIGEANALMHAMRSSARKIGIFVFTVLNLVLILGSLMYLIEGAENGFTSIPKSVYWAIVTLTTVGYGDISPQTPLGQFVASFIMIIGYGIIAVPTAIVTSEMLRPADTKPDSDPVCPVCGWEVHDHDATYCKVCGGRLPASTASEQASIP